MKELVTIRQAEPEDINTIIILIKELAEYEKLSDEVIITHSDLEKALFSSDSFIKVLISEYNHIPVGYALFFPNFSTFKGKPGIYLEDLFVMPEFRGKGIGRKMLEEIISIAKKQECGRVEWSVLDWNSAAIEFYKARGAKPLKEWTIFRLTEDKF